MDAIRYQNNARLADLKRAKIQGMDIKKGRGPAIKGAEFKTTPAIKGVGIKKLGAVGAAAAALIAAGLAVKHFVIDKKQAQGQEKAGLNTAA